MIVGYSVVSNVWVRSSICWAIAFAAAGFDAIIINAFGNTEATNPAKILFVVSIVGAVLLWMVGEKIGECNRVIPYVIIFGLFGIAPLLSAFVVMCFLSLLFLPAGTGFYTCLFIGCLTFCCLAITKVRIDGSAIVESALTPHGKFLFVSRLHVFPMPGLWQWTIAKWRADISLLVAIGIFLSYVLQGNIRQSIGDEAVFFCITLMGAPYAIWCLLQFVCGAYIWVFAIARVEKAKGKIVVFHSGQMSCRLAHRWDKGTG